MQKQYKTMQCKTIQFYIKIDIKLCRYMYITSNGSNGAEYSNID